ncbi:MAG TPA: cold-shock protein [Firmicutes bacterium]|nr:cold-shock protein [Bacillota bacterium]
MKGKVIRFNPEKGFGFIKTDDGKDVFFHYSSLVMDGFKTIEVNSIVEFDIQESEKGLRASNIKKVA